MRGKLLKVLLIAEAVLILVSGGCDNYRKKDYAADATFVIGTIEK